MSAHLSARRPGFAVLEALIALLLVGIGLLAVSKLQALSLSGSGESKSRSEAANLSQKKLEELRNILLRSGFTAMASGSTTVAGSNASYAMSWTVSTPNAGLDQRLLQLQTTWTNAKGQSERLDLNSLIAWDDPGGQARLTKDTTGSLISPTGQALRGNGSLSPTLGTANPDGTRLYTDPNSKITYLMSSTGSIILYLNPKNGTAQAFTTITGRVYFDQNAGNNALPSSDNVRVRLSSEGECVYDNASAHLTAVSGGSNSYKYFTYRCYVGPGWYGNVGVTIDDSVNGNAASPTVCVGDPSFNNGVSDGTLISANSAESAMRSYRGFRNVGGSYLATGMAGGSRYGLSYNADGSAATGPFDGKPVPSGYPSYYSGISAGSATDYFDQDFLLTKIPNNGSCKSKMDGGMFTRNAGAYVCISPDAFDTIDDVCPSVWPGFESQVGSGGSINYTLSVVLAGTGSGTVTSSTGGINCGSTCSASVASGTTILLTATPASGSTFAGWSGCTSSSGTSCTVTVSASTTVTASFTGAPTGSYALDVTKSGSGGGTVTSSPAGISCGNTCTANFSAGTTVTLTATPDSGSSFAGWGGACAGTGSCAVTLSAATSVTATFNTTATTQTLTISKSGAGSGTVTSAPAGISCGSTCSASFATGSSVTLTATPAAGSSFAGWSGGGCSGTGSCTVTMSAATSVSASFSQNTTCTTPVSGSAHDKNGTVDASPSTYGSCAMANGNSSNYSCSFSAPSGTTITLTNARTNGSNSYSYSLAVTANCTAQTNVNFP